MNLKLLSLLLLISPLITQASAVESPCEHLERLPSRVSFADPKDYVAALGCKRRLEQVRVRGLFGRVLKGKTPEDFISLSNDPLRKIIFFMGNDGLEGLLGLDNRQILTKIGYTEEYIQRLKDTGYSFKLVVFQEHGDDALPATWDNVASLVQKHYSSVAPKVQARLTDLKAKKFAEIEAEAPSRFAEVDKIGKSRPDYMDAARLERGQGLLWEVRAFLYYQLRLMELFSGDGLTRTSDGSSGLREYIGANRPIASLKNPAVLDLDF